MTEGEIKTDAAAASPGPGKRRLWLKILGVVVAVVIVVVALLPYIMPTKWLAAIVERAAKSNIRGPVSIGGVSWGWLGGVNVNEITIGEAPEFGAGTFVKVSRVSVQVSFLDLLSKKITVKSVTVDKPQITLVRNEQGAWNFDKLFALRKRGMPIAVAAVGPDPTAGFDLTKVSVGRVRVREGSLSLQDRKDKISLDVTDIAASVDADFSGETITGKADASFGIAQAAGKGTFELAANDINVPKTASADALRKAAVNGTITLTGIDVAEAAAAVKPDLKDLAAGKLTIAINYDLKNGTAKLSAKNGTLKGLTLGKGLVANAPMAIGDVTVGFDVTAVQSADAASVAVKSLDLSMPFGSVGVTGKGDFGKAAQSVSMKASGSIDPAAIPKGLVSLPPEFQSSGSTKFDVSFEGNPQPKTVSVSLDATPMKVAYGGVLRKNSGVPFALALNGGMSGNLFTADKIVVTLSGGQVSGSGAFDSDASAASWNIGANFKGLNISDYYPGSKSLVASGGFTNSGKFFLTTPKRASSFVVDAKFDNFSLDATDTPGTEAVISGAVAMDSVKAQAQNLVVTLGGSPLTVDALVQTPLERPTGKVTIRGREISVDKLMAVATALQSSVPAAEGAKAAPAPKPGEEKTAAEKARTAANVYLDNANVTLEVAIDRLTYDKYTGDSVSVDAAVQAGKATLRKCSVNMFGGTIDITANTDLTSSSMPLDAAVKIASVQTNSFTQKYLSKWLPAMGFNGTASVDMSAKGNLGGSRQSVLDSFSGSGLVDILNGVLSIGELPPALGAALPGLSLLSIPFPEQKIPLTLANGAVSYEYLVPGKPHSIFVEGKTYLSGAYVQKVGIVPFGSDARIHLLDIESGKKTFVNPAEFVADLAKAQLTGILRKPAAPEAAQGAQPQSKEGQAIQGIGNLIEGLTGKKEQKQKPKAKPKSSGSAPAPAGTAQ